jgi:hypothetical protein
MIAAGSARQAGRGRVAAPFHPPSPPRSAKPRQKAHRKALPNSPYANGSGLKQIGRLRVRIFDSLSTILAADFLPALPKGAQGRCTKVAAATQMFAVNFSFYW